MIYHLIEGSLKLEIDTLCMSTHDWNTDTRRCYFYFCVILRRAIEVKRPLHTTKTVQC